jgi:precorrin-2 dehydrogenase/sirohydrochlorin ferrochelatase
MRRGALTIAVSTSGRSPALSSWLRSQFEVDFGPEYETLLELLSTERDAIRSTGRSTEGLDWRSALDSGMLDLIREGQLVKARERLQACLSSSSD